MVLYSLILIYRFKKIKEIIVIYFYRIEKNKCFLLIWHFIYCIYFLTVTTASPIEEELKLCPELVDQVNLAENCPKECPQGMLCNGEACVDPIDCPCVLDGVLFKVSILFPFLFN